MPLKYKGKNCIEIYDQQLKMNRILVNNPRFHIERNNMNQNVVIGTGF